VPVSHQLQRLLGGLVLAALPVGAAIADVAPQATATGGFTFDAQTAVLLVLAIGTGWALRVVLRRYGEGTQKLGTTKRDRLQPNL